MDALSDASYVPRAMGLYEQWLKAVVRDGEINTGLDLKWRFAHASRWFEICMGLKAGSIRG